MQEPRYHQKYVYISYDCFNTIQLNCDYSKRLMFILFSFTECLQKCEKQTVTTEAMAITAATATKATPTATTTAPNNQQATTKKSDAVAQLFSGVNLHIYGDHLHFYGSNTPKKN